MKLLKIIFINREKISLKCKIESKGYWPGVEAIAQSCGLHLRYLHGFKKHVFLAKLGKLELANKHLLGKFLVRSRLISITKSSAKYQGFLCDINDSNKYVMGEFLLTCTNFSEDFKYQLIVPHFKGLFECLMNTEDY
ncbi:hypothetical protein [Desulfothermus sp.]